VRKLSVLCLAGFCAVSGCGPDEATVRATAQLKGLSNLYLDYAISRNGAGPATEQDFKKHLRGMPDHVLGSNGIDPKALDAAFISARDQEPFVVLYGLRISSISAKSAPVVVHEKTGKDGTLLAGCCNGKVEQVDSTRLKELLEGKE
jgi:hypothetical protein